MANSPILLIPLLSTSQAAKETTINTMVSYLERAMNDTIIVPLAGGDYDIPGIDLRRYFYWKFTGAGASSEINIVVPQKRLFTIDNISNGNALTLNNGSASMTIPANAIVIVMATETPTLVSVADSSVMGGGGGATAFTGLSDTFASYATHAKHVIRVKNDLTGLEAVALNYSDLADVDVSPISNGQVMIWNTGTSKFEAGDMTGGAEDAMIAEAVRAASVGNNVLASVISGYTLDGVTLATDDRILLKDQTTGTQNGIYVVGPASSVRSADMPALADLKQGFIVPVLEGVSQKESVWMLMTDMASVGSSVLTFVQPTSTFDRLADYDTSVTLLDGMVMIYDVPTGKWIPSVTSTSLPTGGSAGQALTKNSGTDFDFVFRTLVPAGGTTGQVLAKTSGTDYASAWVTPGSSPPYRLVTGTTDTPVIGDANGSIGGSNAADITFTIPPNSSVAYPVGTTLTILQIAAGNCIIAEGAGVTVNVPATFLPNSAEQYATLGLLKIATDEWILTGQMEAA